VKKILQWIFFFICLTLFLVFRLHAFLKKTPPTTYAIEKPKLPHPVIVSREHPWLQRQPMVKGASIEIVRDLEKIRHLAASASNFSEEELTELMMVRLESLQGEIPFSFPEELYNVLCITESTTNAPAHFRTFQRRYLGETELGMPFYLDVRVFDLNACKTETIMSWFLKLLDGKQEEISPNRFFCKGKRRADQQDASHGFASLQGERGIFLDFVQKEDKLFVCYAEAPLATFERFSSLLLCLARK
jgi:hypothetical protein